MKTELREISEDVMTNEHKENVEAYTKHCFRVQSGNTRVYRYSNYRGTDITSFSRLNHGDLKPLEKPQTPEQSDFLMPELLSGSDYCSSGSVEVSNHRVFLERYGKRLGVYDVYGGYGTFAVAVRLDSITPEMLEDLNTLYNYPVLDEDALSEVELEAENEAWENCYRSEFIRELAKRFPDFAIENLSEDNTDKLFHELGDRTNTYWEHEQGNNAYIDVERIVKGATEQDITRLPKRTP